MPRFGTVCGIERAVVDGEHRLLEPRSPSVAALLGASLVPAGA